ncbi:MAG: hypothetical protein LAO24_09030 [Acidobacteriia bacterium]|nr:hypothetical protein [Terriglobia bacterium]
MEFLIKCGFMWADLESGLRRIAIVSMPCESPAAGLVALGAMRRRLALVDANDSLSHFQRMERLADQRECETFLRHDTFRGRFRLESKDPRGFVWVRGAHTASARNGPLRTVIFPSHANEWRFDGEAPMQNIQGTGLPYASFYGEMIQGAQAPMQSNLSKSDSGICLAGRVSGESVSKGILDSIRFQIQDQVVALPNLLTIQRWSPGTISRVTFFNTRTGQIDRSTGCTRVVVTDGDGAFLKVIEATEFRDSTIVGVVHRVLERDRLESIGVKIAELAQWYAPDNDLLNQLPQAPGGITISALKRR